MSQQPERPAYDTDDTREQIRERMRQNRGLA